MSHQLERQLHPIPEFKDFALSEDSIGYTRDSKDGTTKSSSGEKTIALQYQGKNLYCTIIHEQVTYYAVEGNVDREYFNYIISDNTGQLGIEANINLSKIPDLDQAFLAIMTIHRIDKLAQVPNGTGIILYEKMLQCLTNLANKRNIIIKHAVKRYPEISKTPMTNERWDEIFVPILKSHGYTPVSDSPGDWVKEYQPTQSTSHPQS